MAFRGMVVGMDWDRAGKAIGWILAAPVMVMLLIALWPGLLFGGVWKGLATIYRRLTMTERL